MTSKQKLIILFGAIGFIVVGVYIYRAQTAGPERMQEQARKQTEKYLYEQLKPAIRRLKSTGTTSLGREFELKGKHAGGTSFTDVILTRKTGDKVEVEYHAESMKIVFKNVPVAVLTHGEEIKYEEGKEKETTTFTEKDVQLRPYEPSRKSGGGMGSSPMES